MLRYTELYVYYTYNTIHRTAPNKKKYPFQYIRSAKADKLCPKLRCDSEDGMKWTDWSNAYKAKSKGLVTDLM